MLRILFSTLALLLTTQVHASSISLQQALSQLPDGNDTALLVADSQTGEVLYQQRADQLQPPASTQKMLTALAAQLYLGPQYRFTTRVETRGNDLIFRFSGDPTLTRTQLTQLLQQLKKKGITSISGDILLNGGQFTSYERAPGWPWDILGVCYSAPASSLTLEHNCVQGALYSNRSLGEPTRVNIPSHQPITVTTNAVIVNKAQHEASHCELELDIAGTGNTYHLDGCLVKRDQPLPLKFAVQDTTDYISKILRSELTRQRINFKGKIKRDDKAQGQLVVQHQSQPLNVLLDIMVKASDNLIADNLTKTLGARYYKQPGSFKNGVAAIEAILKEKAGITLDNAVLVDGSGLSRNNRLTAEQMLQVIAYIRKHDNQLGLLKTFPVSGESGTLQYRRSIRQKPLQGQIHAKSGSLYGTYNLAGILTAKSGRELLFVQLVTNYHPPKQDKNAPAVTPPIQAFENTLYHTLYEQF